MTAGDGGDPVTGGRPAVLVLRALGLGDFLAGVPTYRALRAGYPDHQIVLAAPQPLAPLAALTGAIDSVLPTRELAPVAWRGLAPAVAIDLHGNGPASHRLVSSLGAATTMTYASAADPGVTGPWWDNDEHEVDRWCRLVEWWGLPADRDALRINIPWIRTSRPSTVVLHPGAASTSRRWPAARFAAVARTLSGQGHHIVITGIGPEQDLALRVAAQAGLSPDSVAAGRTTLLELAALVGTAALVISNDTGIAHLAVALATPSVTLFGPVSPALWGPPAGSGRHLALWKGTGSRPGDPHGQQVDPRLLRICVDEVLSAVAGLQPIMASRAASGQPT
jgi:ADP-heptose:LPS heptosyltransferase